MCVEMSDRIEIKVISENIIVSHPRKGYGWGQINIPGAFSKGADAEAP